MGGHTSQAAIFNKGLKPNNVCLLFLFPTLRTINVFLQIIRFAKQSGLNNIWSKTCILIPEKKTTFARVECPEKLSRHCSAECVPS